MIILDTDVLTLVQSLHGEEYRRLSARLDQARDEVYVTIVTFEEQMRGWLSLAARSRSVERQIRVYARLRSHLDDYRTRPILDFDSAAAREYEDLRRLKIRIGTMDLKIAAIALGHNALLVSRNLVDFQRVPNLRVEDWTVGD